MISLILEELHKKKNPKKAVDSQRFFKTAQGEYAAGDIFLGVTVPEIRAISRKWKEADFTTLKRLLCSKIHEERLLALFILVLQFENSLPNNNQNRDNKNKQQKIYKAKVNPLRQSNKKSWVKVDLYQGLNLQIKKMFWHLKIQVLKIKRFQIGNIHLADLKSGQYRLLKKRRG